MSSKEAKGGIILVAIIIVGIAIGNINGAVWGWLVIGILLLIVALI